MSLLTVHMFARALLAFVMLPGLMAFGVPLWLAWPALQERAFRSVGLVPLISGVVLLLWCVRDFYVAGKGTLAPWDPPRHLVIVGLYRISRNPMYVAVSLVLVGWALGVGSRALWIYALIVMAAFHLRVVFGEEPWLARTHGDAWTRYRARVPRWLFLRRKTSLLFLLGLAIVLAAAGFVYETVAGARAARQYPAPGVMVDVGGRRLHLICIGKGQPTVLFESSSFGSSLSSSAARERLARRTTVCSYDRMGKAWSDAGPRVQSAGMLARDLAVLQDRAKLQAPFVIVTSSIGGLTTEMFARRYPERVAGLIFLDAGSSLGLLRLTAARAALVTALACTAGAMARLGFVRFIDLFDIGSASEGARRGAAITYSAKSWAVPCAMARGLEATRREFDEAPPLAADVPLVVLSASSAREALPAGLETIAESLRPAARESHQQLAKRSSRGSWRMVPDSTHLIASSQPDAVVEAVLTLIDGPR